MLASIADLSEWLFTGREGRREGREGRERGGRREGEGGNVYFVWSIAEVGREGKGRREQCSNSVLASIARHCVLCKPESLP